MSIEELHDTAQRVVAAANERPELTNARTKLTIGTPRYRAEVDREKSRALGVPVSEVFAALQSTFGSFYVNDFTMMGRNWQVNMQAEGEFRVNRKTCGVSSCVLTRGLCCPSARWWT